MRRMKVLSTVTRLSDLVFEDFYDSVANDWQRKARRLQARRWRKLKHQLV